MEFALKGRQLDQQKRIETPDTGLDICVHRASPVVLVVKEPACQCRRLKRLRFHPWVGKIPLRRASQPTPVFLLGESYGQRSPVGCNPYGHTESDTLICTHSYAYYWFSTSVERQFRREKIVFSINYARTTGYL